MAGILDTVAILFNKKQSSIATATGSLSVVLDASVSETHISSADITSHPVELGANITDHVHRLPDTITIQGIVSNTSTAFPTALPGVALINSASNLISGVSNDLAKKAYDDLRSLVEGKELVKVVTTLREYDSMLLENLSVTRDAENADCLNFTMTARQVRIITTSTKEAIPSPADSKKASKKSLGKKSTKPLGGVSGTGTAATLPANSAAYNLLFPGTP